MPRLRPFVPVPYAFVFCLATLFVGLTPADPGYADQPPMSIAIDARELPRKLVDARLTIPLQAVRKPRRVALWYPKWVPGSHGPGGPVANIAGLEIYADDGSRLNWKRTPGEVYRLEVMVPADVQQLRVELRYIASQPATNSFGHDCFGSDALGILSPGCLLLYPEGADIDRQEIVTQLQLPPAWRAASALPLGESAEEASDAAPDRAVTLREFVDSPIMVGAHYTTYDLVDDHDLAPPHQLHVFADRAEGARLNDAVVAKLKAMVQQTALLMGSHPFASFDILLAASDALPKNGLEHARSTLNVLPPSSLKSPAAMKGWDRLLIPHEYLHAWCGKYRRPEGMLTDDFHTAKDTELLWVYEGLTQYLGELIEARSGWMSGEEFRHRLLVELRSAVHQQGRRWRSLADTGAAAHILRAGSPQWGGLRRSQDFYMEGMLFWLEADARIRRMTEGRRSLDDFCRRFFAAGEGNAAAKPYRRADVVAALQATARYDWDALIARRVESFQQEFDPAVAGLLGYDLVRSASRPEIPGATFRHTRGVDQLDSIGLLVGNDGQIRRILLGSPADQAQLSPTMKIIGVGWKTWSADRLTEAIAAATDRRPIELLVVHGEDLQRRQIQYYEGPRYWSLKRQPNETDFLNAILQPRK